MTISKSFTAVKQASAWMQLQPGEELTYSLSGTYTLTATLEYSRNGGLTFDNILTASTPNATVTGTFKNNLGLGTIAVRWFCQAFTSGTGVTTMVSVAEVSQEFVDGKGTVVMQIAEGEVRFPGTVGNVDFLTSEVKRTVQRRIYTVGAKVGATAGWEVNPANDTALLATLPASQTSSTLVLPIPRLKVLDAVVKAYLIGRMESAGANATISVDCRKHTIAAGAIADVSIGTLGPLTVTADTALTLGNTEIAATLDNVAATETFYLLITGTTAALTAIELTGFIIECTEK